MTKIKLLNHDDFIALMRKTTDPIGIRLAIQKHESPSKHTLTDQELEDMWERYRDNDGDICKKSRRELIEKGLDPDTLERTN